MCSGGVTVTIIGVDVDAAMAPILTMFSGSNLTGSGVSDILEEWVTLMMHWLYYIIAQFANILILSLLLIDLHSPVCHLPVLSGALHTRWCGGGCSVQLLHHL